MVVMHYRAHCPAGVGAAVAVRAGALTQTQLQMIDAAPHVSGCRDRLGPLLEARRDGPLSCRWCAGFGELCCQVEELKEEVSRLCSIREDERERQDLLRDATTSRAPEPNRSDVCRVCP